MKASDRYHKWVEWSEEDQAYLGKCPDLITGIHGDDPVQVYADLCEDEQPLLLDPACAADPNLLWFDQDGHAVPNPAECGESEYFLKRAQESIRLYHLNQVGIRERRQVLYNDIQRLVEKAGHFLTKYQNGDPTARDAYEVCLQELIAKTKAEAEFSSAARAMLMGLRGNSVVDAVLRAA